MHYFTGFLKTIFPPASGYYSIVMAERNLLYFYDSKIEYQAFDLNNKYIVQFSNFHSYVFYVLYY